MKPCIIIWSRLHERFEAFNEDGRLLCWSLCHETWLLFTARLYVRGFEHVPLNSRLGRTIRDKIEANSAL